ncbi:hypothetical protein [uncultured Sulfitobacter sp.]|uniref:hypothetical protein n=1 Tax=uncultured Sulfitobacter sp. TaxID=191468 RepID=UPI002638D36A|nr:hypothetical protein [uncultured Sulfitobacter sp.]
MAHENKVIHSVNLYGDAICVDIFQRPDASFGFDEFRRDEEDGQGWFSIGHFGEQQFTSVAQTIEAAIGQVGWFEGV